MIKTNKIHPRSKGKKAIRQALTTVRRTLKKGKCSKGQLRTALLLSRMLKNASYKQEVTWDWLETKDYTLMYLDIFFDKHNLAVEFHGEQHFKYPNFFHKNKQQFIEAKKRDNLKKKLLLSKGYKFIEWHFNEPFTEKRAFLKLVEAGISIDQIKNPSPSRLKGSKETRISKISPRRR